jgi:hypothetical protein
MAFLKKSVATGILVVVVCASIPAQAAPREGREPRQRDPILRVIKKIVRVLLPSAQEDIPLPPRP